MWRLLYVRMVTLCLIHKNIAVPLLLITYQEILVLDQRKIYLNPYIIIIKSI